MLQDETVDRCSQALRVQSLAPCLVPSRRALGYSLMI